MNTCRAELDPTTTNPALDFIAYSTDTVPAYFSSSPHLAGHSSTRKRFSPEIHHRGQHDPLLCRSGHVSLTTVLSSFAHRDALVVLRFLERHPRLGDSVGTPMTTHLHVLCFMLVQSEDFTSDVFAFFFNSFSRKCWSSIIGSRLETDPCLRCLGIPVFVRC